MKRIKLSLCLVFILVLLMNIAPFSVGASVEDYDYYIENSSVVLTKYNGNAKEVDIPSEIDGKAIVKIEGTFDGNKTIEKVNLPEGIAIIGLHAFYGCSNLKSVNLPNSLKTIDNFAFSYSGLSEIVLPANTHYINEGAFLGCGNLTAIVSYAEPIATGGKALFIGQSAFKDSKIRAIKTKYTPSYYDNSFTGVCHFTDSSINYAIYRSDFLNTIIEPIRKFSPIESALFFSVFILVLALLVFICIYAVRRILKLVGQDKLGNYKRYGRQVFNDMSLVEQDKQIINYKPILFIRDRIFNAFSKVIGALALFAYIVFLFYISLANHWNMNPFLNAVICVLGGVVASIVAIALVVWLIYKIRSIISDHKEADVAKVRIRTIKGGEKDAQ